MNSDVPKGQLKVIKGTVRKQWGKLTNDNKDKISGSIERTTGKLQKNYGAGKQKVQKMIHKLEP